MPHQTVVQIRQDPYAKALVFSCSPQFFISHNENQRCGIGKNLVNKFHVFTIPHLDVVFFQFFILFFVTHSLQIVFVMQPFFSWSKIDVYTCHLWKYICFCLMETVYCKILFHPQKNQVVCITLCAKKGGYIKKKAPRIDINIIIHLITSKDYYLYQSVDL